MDFIDKALESRQLSQNSINLYKRNLLKLNDNKPVKSFHFLKKQRGNFRQNQRFKTNYSTKLYYIHMFCIKRYTKIQEVV